MPEQMEEEVDRGLLPAGWARSETVTGIPYYVNHAEQDTRWEHPRISELFIQLDGMHDIKFGAYRTAMKLCTLRKATHFNKVRCSVMEIVYKDLGIGPGPKHNQDTYTVEEIEILLTSTFQYVNIERAAHQVPVEECVELTLNYLLKCLDSGRTGKVKVRSLKNVLTALACSSLKEKYTYFYEHICKTGSAGITQSNVKALLLDLTLITDSIEEHTTFAPEYIDDAIKDCWQCSDHFEPTYLLSKNEFLNWMFKEPMCIVWLPTMYRLTSSETVKHEAKCANCKTYPIVGFRYRCLKCINVDLCQACYWTQQTIKNHKITHPTREYCLATTTGDDVRDFGKQLKNKLTRKYKRREFKSSYRKYPTTPMRQGTTIPEDCPVLKNVHTRVNILAGRLLELEGSRSDLSSPRSARDGDIERAQILRASPSPVRQIHMVDQGIQSNLEEEVETRQSLQLQSQVEELQVTNEIEVQRRVECERSLREVESAILAELKDKDDLEQRVQHLESRKKTLEGRVSQLLRIPPIVKTVHMPPPPSSVQSPPPMADRGVNTASTSTLTRGTMGSQMTSILGGEEEEMEAILKELLQAFPKPSKQVTVEALNTEVFQAGAAVRDSLSNLKHQMDKA